MHLCLVHGYSGHLRRGFFRLRRVFPDQIHRGLPIRIESQLSPQLSGQLSHLLRLQQVQNHGLHLARRRLRALPVSGRLSHAGLRHLRRPSSLPSCPALPPGMRRRHAAGGLLRQIRQRFVHRGGGQERGHEEMRAVRWF